MSAGAHYGSARFAYTQELAHAGLVNDTGLFYGYTDEKNPRRIGFSSNTASIVFGAAGSGKFSTLCAYQLHQNETTVFLDPKGEGAATAGMMMPWAQCYFFNPFALHTQKPWFVPNSHQFNVLDFVSANSPHFFDDTLSIALSLIEKPKGGGGNSEHFWGKAVQITHSLLMFLIEYNPQASLVDLYNIMGDIRGGGVEDFFETLHYPAMMASNFDAVRQTADELFSKREKAAGEFESILSTISNALQILGSPAIQHALSSPSTCTMENFVRGKDVSKLFLMIPAHMLAPCAPIIRTIFSALSIVQQRIAQKTLHFLMDEAGQLGHFDKLPQLFSYGRGSMTKVTAVFQNFGQPLSLYGKDGMDTLMSNAQTKSILNVSSYDSAQALSHLLGKTTHYYDAPEKQHAAANKRDALIAKALGQGNVNAHLYEIANHDIGAVEQSAVARPLQTPDELMQMHPDWGILLFQGMGVYPYWYQKRHYFTNPDMAHKFLPNPFHAPFDRMALPKKNGRKKTVPIITETVPAALSHFPQYAQGMWSYPKHHCPYTRKRRWFGLV